MRVLSPKTRLVGRSRTMVLARTIVVLYFNFRRRSFAVQCSTRRWRHDSWHRQNVPKQQNHPLQHRETWNSSRKEWPGGRGGGACDTQKQLADLENSSAFQSMRLTLWAQATCIHAALRLPSKNEHKRGKGAFEHCWALFHFRLWT